MKISSSWRRVVSTAAGDRGRLTLALAEPAYEYGRDAEKNNELLPLEVVESTRRRFLLWEASDAVR